MKRALALLALALACAAAPASELLPFKARYAITYEGLSAGTGELQLRQLPDGRWSYEQRLQPRRLARWLGMSRQVSRSEFRIVDGRVVPETFVSDDNDQDISFDWQSARVAGTVGRKKFNLPTQPGLLDPLSVQVALMQELLSGRMPARFVLVDEDRIKDYLYAVDGSEVIDSVAGQQRVDIFSSRRPGSRKATYFWSAPDLGYIPLKVERRNGKDVELSMTLLSLERP
jgi:hypothetical protein